MIQIQTSISGYGGRRCTLFSAYDQDLRILAVGVEAEYRTDRRPGCLVICNDPQMDRDRLFSDDDFMDAIGAFHDLKLGAAADTKNSRLVFSDRAGRANPDQAIEQDGYDSRGPRFRISEGITCAQVATLATCLYAVSAEAVERAVAFSGVLEALISGRVVTV